MPDVRARSGRGSQDKKSSDVLLAFFTIGFPVSPKVGNVMLILYALASLPPSRLLSQLDSFRPQLFLELGLSADWGEELVSLIRKLEPSNYDPACLQEDVANWFHRQGELFQQLRILEELEDTDADQQSCTWHVVRNAMSCPPLYVQGKCFNLWSASRGDKQTFKDVAERLSNLVEAAKARVQSELLGCPQSDWCIFSMGRWRESRALSVDEQQTFEMTLRCRLRRLLKLAGLSIEAGERQFFQVVHILHQGCQETDMQGRCRKDNREIWARIFSDDLASKANPEGDIDTLRCLVLILFTFFCETSTFIRGKKHLVINAWSSYG